MLVAVISALLRAGGRDSGTSAQPAVVSSDRYLRAPFWVF
jgi:hypothetical protein